MHPSAIRSLDNYTRRREELCPAPLSPSLFVSTTGTRLIAANIRRTFSRLVHAAGLQPRSARCRPRLHDYADLRVMPTLVRKPFG